MSDDSLHIPKMCLALQREDLAAEQFHIHIFSAPSTALTKNSRGSKAVRLTYDHKGSDAQEAKRITDAGGFVMNNRVNGVLAVTRSLGDSSMKEFVVGSPYTTETTLGKEDKFLIIACDGVSRPTTSAT